METNGNGAQLNQSGWYKHKETGATVQLESTPGVGSPVVDAFVNVGFVKMTDSEIAAMQTVVAPEVTADDAETEGETEYRATTDKNGKEMYYKGNLRISKAKYDAREEAE